MSSWGLESSRSVHGDERGMLRTRMPIIGIYKPSCIMKFPLLYYEDINTIVTPTAPAAIHTGPITRARAR